MVIASRAHGAAENMALDEALLDSEGTWLRFYRWEQPTISLGYFQAAQEFADVRANFEFVRRTTGGGAILHADDITFALATDERCLPSSVRESYEIINGAVIEACAAQGHRLCKPIAEPSAARSRWCFARITGLDLVLPDGRKVFGSAQRRRRGRCLQHGSLVLNAHPQTPFTGSLPGVDAAELERAIADHVAARLGLAGKPGRLPQATLEHATALTSHYQAHEWTHRR